MGNGKEKNKETAQKAVAEILNTPAKKDSDSSGKGDLKKALDDASSQTRNLLITFLVFLFYVFFSATGTTHRMLLIPDSTIKVPPLDFGIPVVDFYMVVPLLILVFHFDLLFNLHKHAEKLRAWKDMYKGDELSLYPFIFNFFHPPENAGLITWLPRKLATFLVMLFPLLVLICLEIKFLPYHDSSISFWHVVAVIIDLVLLLIFWPPIINKETAPSAYQAAGKTYWNVSSKEAHKSFVYSIDGFQSPLLIKFLAFCFITSIALPLIPQKLDQGSYFIKLNLDLHGETLLGKEPGLDLIGRHLEYANFSKLKLTKVDLRFALLKGADLSFANLEGAYLNDAQVEGANFFKANLEGTNLSRTQLKGANLVKANLRNADLMEAKLEGAYLNDARVEGANFFKANLKKADLSQAHLEGANLNGANLENAILHNTHLEEAKLRIANLKGASLAGAYLEGAYLRDANLEGADLSFSHLKGTNLHGANLKDVDLSRTNIEDTFFDVGPP